MVVAPVLNSAAPPNRTSYSNDATSVRRERRAPTCAARARQQKMRPQSGASSASVRRPEPAGHPAPISLRVKGDDD
jgi:hypothetical protein